MCGIEAAGFENNEAAMNVAIRKDIMLHAYLLTQSGLPIIYSGDEVAQVNDYTYKDDPEKADDSRYIHRSPFNWKLVKNIDKKNTVQHHVFTAIQKLEEIRRSNDVFDADADVAIVDYSDPAILWITRHAGKRRSMQSLTSLTRLVRCGCHRKPPTPILSTGRQASLHRSHWIAGILRGGSCRHTVLDFVLMRNMFTSPGSWRHAHGILKCT